MGILYKADWEETKQRYRAWWDGEYIGRCGLWVSAPRDNLEPEEPPVAPADPYELWTSLEYRTALNDFTHRRTFYGGEAFPIWHPGYPGHTSIPSFFNCPFQLDMNTGWHDAILTDEDLEYSKLKLDPENHWWQFTMKLLRHAVKVSKNRCIPAVVAFGGCGDTLASLRDTSRLLLDVVDRPEQVQEMELYLMKVWCEVYEQIYTITSLVSDNGATTWYPLWAPGKYYPTQCDFAYMISTEMFQELFLPAIRMQLDYLDYSVYHVDGIGNFKHVPVLCEFERLQGLQILPGAGKPSVLTYRDVLECVQAKGKNLYLIIDYEEVQAALEMLSAKGLFIQTRCPDEQTARELLQNVQAWSKP